MNFNTFKSCIYYNRIPDVVTGFYMAAALGVSVEYLATGDEGKLMKTREKQALIRKAAAAKIKKMAQQIERNSRLIE